MQQFIVLTTYIDMTTLPLTCLATLLTVALMFWTAINVGKARAKYEVHAPATSGHEMFDRAYRVQMNTLESAILLLPSMWLYAGLIGDLGAGVSGAIWLAGRIWYALAYQQDPAKRGPGFGISLVAIAGMWAGSLWAVIQLLLA
jgi:glutathione S-transferase